MMSGPNVAYTKMLTEKTGLDVVASGGVSGMEDLNMLYQNGITGVVIGKALYEGKISLAEAVKKFS